MTNCPLSQVLGNYLSFCLTDIDSIVNCCFSDILGMVTLGNLMSKVVSGKAKPSDLATDLRYEQFTKVHSFQMYPSNTIV